MSLLAVAYVRTSLGYLVLGSGLGGWLLVEKAVHATPWIWALRPLHVDWLFLGWTLQLALGVASWVLPRPGSTVWHRRLGWASYGLLNGGLGLITLVRLTDAGDLLPVAPELIGVGHLLVLMGALAFIGSVRHRVAFVPTIQR